jgi:NitT/TauT family transport system substrate-binding protein
MHEKLLEENAIYFLPTPSRVMLSSDYVSKVGLLANKAASWRDYFFENVHAKPGS